MNHIQRKSPFWSLAGPLLAYLAIQWAVQFAVELVITIPYIANSYFEMVGTDPSAVMSVEEMKEFYMELLQPVYELIVRHQVEIAGAAAFCTLFLSIPLILHDRKLEKKFGIAKGGRFNPAGYCKVFVFGISGTAAATCLMSMVQIAFYDETYSRTSQIAYAASFPVQVLALGIIIPVAEELMFRGILFKRFRERQQFWYSAGCSSIFFALMHTNGTQMIYSFLLGLMLAYLVEKSGSLKASFLLHFVMNTGALILTKTGVFSWLGAVPIRMAGAVIFGTFICSVMFVLIQKENGMSVTEQSDKKIQ